MQGVFIFPANLGNDPARLIKKMMNIDPSLRPTAQEIFYDKWF